RAGRGEPPRPGRPDVLPRRRRRPAGIAAGDARRLADGLPLPPPPLDDLARVQSGSGVGERILPRDRPRSRRLAQGRSRPPIRRVAFRGRGPTRVQSPTREGRDRAARAPRARSPVLDSITLRSLRADRGGGGAERVDLAVDLAA